MLLLVLRRLPFNLACNGEILQPAAVSSTHGARYEETAVSSARGCCTESMSPYSTASSGLIQ